METETKLKLKCPRLDNKDEYIDGGIKEYCVANNIWMEKIISSIQQHNGVAKHMNEPSMNDLEA